MKWPKRTQRTGARRRQPETVYAQADDPESSSLASPREHKADEDPRVARKPSDDPIQNLVKAGALIAAEIDRLQRKAKCDV